MKRTVLALCAVAAAITAADYSVAGGMRRELTPEERLIYVQQEHGPQWRSMSLQQRCARQQQIRQHWASMNPAGLRDLKQQLDARWNAMPVAERQRIEQRIADRQARPARTSGHGRRSACASSAAP